MSAALPPFSICKSVGLEELFELGTFEEPEIGKGIPVKSVDDFGHVGTDRGKSAAVVGVGTEVLVRLRRELFIESRRLLF